MSLQTQTLINGVFNEAQNISLNLLRPFDKISVQGVFTDTGPDADTGIAVGESEVSTLTPDTQANSVNGDQFIFYDRAGNHYSIWLNVTGESSPPTGALYLSATEQIEVSLDALGDKEVSIITFETLANFDEGDYFALHTPGGVTHAVYIAKSGTSAPPAGTVAAAADYVHRIPTHYAAFTGSTATQVATFAAQQLALTELADDFTITDGEDGTISFTCKYPGNTSNAEVHDATDSGAGNFQAATDTAGVLDGTVAAICDAIIAQVDDTLDGVFTLSDETTHVEITCVEEGVTTNAVEKDIDEDATGSITAATTNAGVDGSSAAADDFYIEAHGYEEGTIVRLTTGGTLPAGLSTGTDYYVINKDANHIQFATTLANAKAGTAVDITDTGTGTFTVTVEALASVTVKLQRSNDNVNWMDVSSLTQTIDDPSSNQDDFFWDLSSALAAHYRLNMALTKGQLSAKVVAAFI